MSKTESMEEFNKLHELIYDSVEAKYADERVSNSKDEYIIDQMLYLIADLRVEVLKLKRKTLF